MSSNIVFAFLQSFSFMDTFCIKPPIKAPVFLLPFSVTGRSASDALLQTGLHRKVSLPPCDSFFFTVFILYNQVTLIPQYLYNIKLCICPRTKGRSFRGYHRKSLKHYYDGLYKILYLNQLLV